MKERKNRNKRLWIRVSDEEYQQMVEASKGHKSCADYIRKRIFGKGKDIINPVEFIRAIDEVSLEMKRIGKNINQFARYANERKSVDGDFLMEEYNKLLSDYIKKEQKLEVLYRKIIAL
ncbi:plasmid mobilization protein [Bacteroides fragilis]|uniref:Uncharacterized protein n=1 Tax=Bacteroides fragilis (strain YCH46) TaxID=295405 RepID=Q64MF8_BACFR|nr:plasmid mobilization relaxosome protein MobC [Bacteroides fragilis]BAD51329.1 conserved hypothetical protein [Bacteroides fragilis YCH46]